ncbi:ATP-dependent DNA helicase [Metabacillus fastidiosus]|uniref:ATP-dependent DNA helicase n=1 Tax=Metabacillus fastidiosus TaxID=1458 RepID=UPI0008248A89|nr:ATP-dependent DNA helicase [Metabacillus fastidiosus]
MNSKADVILEIFEEKLRKHYGTSAIRESQVQMALDIGEFLESSKRLMVIEAPVGTGKSLGVLVPALVDRKYSMYNKRSLMYATATINLQGQLMGSEIPLLSSIGLVKYPIIAKGKTHYYCHYRFKELERGREYSLFSPRDREIMEKFYQTSKTGQRSELEGEYGFDIEDEKWKKVELPMNSNCRDCSLSMLCPTIAHRRRFKSPENDVVITNHDQLITSFLTAMDEEGIYEPVLKTDMGIVVIDEAHEFLETFIGRLEKTFTISHLKKVEKYIDKDKYKWTKSIHELRKWIETNKADNEKADTGRYMLNDSVLAILKELNQIINDNLFQASLRKAEILDKLSSVLYRFTQTTKYTSWISLENNMFHVVENNYKEVFRKMLNHIMNVNKVIFMSGTLTVNGDFSHIMNQWDIRPKEAMTKILNCPFDYKNQALIYIPEGLGDPNKDEFIEKALEEVHNLLKITGGRTLLLNTSKHHMDGIYTGIKDKLYDDDIPLYKQGESGVEKLTERFKKTEESVLVGSGSFFSGFSIAGTSLTSVIINKLPFPAHNDPIVELISRGINKNNIFNQVSYPMMVNKLDQAVGRLIRSIEDYGIVTILDERIYTANYGKKIQELLEGHGYILTRSWDEVKSFYEKKLEKGAEAKYKQYSRSSLIIGDQLRRPNKKVIGKEKHIQQKIEQKSGVYISGNITKIQTSFLIKVCQDNEFMIILKGSTELVFKEVCRILYMKELQVKEIMKDFPYRNDTEKEELSKYLELKGTSRTVEMVHVERVGEKKPKIIKKEQREFLKRLIENEGLDISIGRIANNAYISVYKELYNKWKDTKLQYLREYFPYQDEEEKRELSTYHGGERKRVYPLCVKLGCDGTCSEEQHGKITQYLVNTYKATRVLYMEAKEVHRIQIEPIEILDYAEFRPDELLQTV